MPEFEDQMFMCCVKSSKTEMKVVKKIDISHLVIDNKKPIEEEVAVKIQEIPEKVIKAPAIVFKFPFQYCQTSPIPIPMNCINSIII